MEWHGTFEIPQSDRRVGGRLVIDESESLLRLYGSLASGGVDDLDDRVPLLWGTTETGHDLTLLGLTRLRSSWFGPGLRRSESWICAHAIEGHILPQDPLTFSAVKCGMTYLSSWLEAPAPSGTYRVDGVTIEARPVLIGRVELDDITYEFHNSVSRTSGFDLASIRYPSWVTALPPDEQQLEELVNDHITPVEALLWLATDRFSEMSTEVRLEGERGSGYAKVWSSALKPIDFEPPTRRLVRSEMLFTANEIPGGLEGGLARWLSRWSEISHALGPVIARYRAPFSYTNDRLATSVAALESYSRVDRPWGKISDEEMSRRRETIRNALAPVDAELVDWTIEGIENNTRETLRRRLKDLLDAAGDLEKELLGNVKNRRQFLNEGVESRNRIAHLLPAGGLSEGGSLHWAHRGFNWLLRFHLMTDLGFSAEETAERIKANSRFRQEAERLQEDLESRR